MTKKPVSALLIAMAITATGFSKEILQLDSSAATKTKKNEIGINISPAVAFMLGAFPSTFKFAASFKHIVKEKNAFRFSANYLFNWNENAYWFDSNNFNIISQTDSTQLRR